jgi:hypothetical protein
VGYSRVHTGVHYPGDVVVGSREQPPDAQDPDAEEDAEGVSS